MSSQACQRRLEKQANSEKVTIVLLAMGTSANFSRRIIFAFFADWRNCLSRTHHSSISEIKFPYTPRYPLKLCGAKF